MNFIEDFRQLLRTKPRYNLKHVMCENCDYSDTAVKSKNCYYSFCVFYCEDVYYGRYSRKCTSCSGITFCANCEWCNECVDCIDCYGLDYSQDCQNCSDSQYLIDCTGCRDCFGCVGLYQKQYRMFNEQLTKEEYEQRLAQLDLDSQQHRDMVEAQVQQLRKQTPQLGIHQFNTEDCTGDHITESKGCHECYDIFTSEDCIYNIEANANTSCCDLTVCFETEASYECVQCPLCYDCNFCIHLDNSKNSEFCAYGRNLRNCFGCVYMENKEYHILNKPYSPEDYEVEVARIKKELQESGNYNMSLYILGKYELDRLATETDPVIQPIITF